MKYRLSALLSVVLLFWAGPAIAQIDAISRASVSTTGGDSNGVSTAAAVSSNGASVAFRSTASDLVTGDTNGKQDVFIYNVGTGVTTRLSLSNTRMVQANDDSGVSSRASHPILISPDGRYVAYASDATNLVTSDQNGTRDIFVGDTQLLTTARVNIAFSVTEANNTCEEPALSDDGLFFGFSSIATNFDTSDQNGKSDVFRRNNSSLTTSPASNSTGGTAGNDDSYSPSLSSDGSVMAYSSGASTLVSGDTNSVSDIFVHAFSGSGGVTTRVSVNSAGSQSDAASEYPVISGNGRYVVFESDASNLVSGDKNGMRDIYLYDLQEQVTERISVNRTGRDSNGPSRMASISADGRYVAFLSSATNIVAGDTNGTVDVFVRDRQAPKTLRVNLSADQVQGTRDVLDAMISSDGMYVGFSTDDSGLVSGDANGVSDVFLALVREVITPDTRLTSPPIVTVNGTSAVCTMKPFAGASLEKDFEPARAAARVAAAKRPAARLQIRYKLVVQGSGTAAGVVRRRLAKRNVVTLRNLPAGMYTAKYKVQVTKKDKRKFSTNTSPSASFTIGS